MQSVLKLIAVHFQFMEDDDLNIIAYRKTWRILQWSSSSESKPLYKLLLYVNENLKYRLVVGFMYAIVPDSIVGKHNLVWS